MTKYHTYFLCVSLLLTDVFCLFFSTQNGPDGDVKDDLDSGDEADGKKIDTEEVRTKIIIPSTDGDNQNGWLVVL